MKWSLLYRYTDFNGIYRAFGDVRGLFFFRHFEYGAKYHEYGGL
jgi:hypothetical protein